MIRRPVYIFCLLALLPAPLVAQEGSIAYSHSIEVEIDPQLRERLQGMRGRGGRGGFEIPSQRTEDVILIFNATEALMKPVPRQAGEGRRGRGGDVLVRGDMTREMVFRIQGAAATRSARDNLVEVYTAYAEGTVVEQRELLGREFLIEDHRPAYQWKLSGEQAEFLGYVVQKATAVHDSTTIEAWFTPQIPVMGGPAGYGGLPGMILVVSVNDGQEQYQATAVSMSAVAEGVIVRPEEGDEVSREEYETIVAEKLEELRMTRGRGR